MSVASPSCEEYRAGKLLQQPTGSNLAIGGCRTGRGPSTSTQIYTQGLSVKVCVLT